MARALRLVRAQLEALQHVAGLLAYHTRPRAAVWGERRAASAESLRDLVEMLEGK